MYRLPSERIGRMIKVKRAELINAVLTVFTIIAVICGTCSIYSLADSDSTTDSIVFKDAAVLAENFNVYHGESAVTAGLSAAYLHLYRKSHIGRLQNLGRTGRCCYHGSLQKTSLPQF